MVPKEYLIEQVVPIVLREYNKIVIPTLSKKEGSSDCEECAFCIGKLPGCLSIKCYGGSRGAIRFTYRVLNKRSL